MGAVEPLEISTIGRKTVFLPKPRGFCAGVIRAIDIVTIALEKLGRPVYVRKEIVHNGQVVGELAAQGAVLAKGRAEVPAAARRPLRPKGASREAGAAAGGPIMRGL